MDDLDAREARRAYDEQTTALIGRRLLDLTYWDIHNFSDEPRTWDYGDWHHAVMGVGIDTDDGPFCVMWTNRFFPYGVEVFHQPITDHLVLGPQGPEGWSASESKAWRIRRGSLVRGAETFWERIEVGPALNGGGDVVAGSAAYDVPVALRIDLDAGPVWMVAGIPQHPDVENVFVPDDEIVVAFSEDRMRKIGFDTSDFLVAVDPDSPTGHEIEVVASDDDHRRPNPLFRWKCSCGVGGGGRWHRSFEQASKAADKHIRKVQS